MAAGRLGEFELIYQYLAPLAVGAGAAALRDDAATYCPEAGHELVISKDMLAADRHFFACDPPEMIARKALRVNFSDIAAKGARPKAVLLGLGLGADFTEDFAKSFCKGLAEDLVGYGVELLGGDTIASGAGLILSVTAFGEMPQGSCVRRFGARAGDIVYATGTIGDAALGLQLRLKSDAAQQWRLDGARQRELLDRYLLPEPRVDAANAVRLYANAAMDVSDGLIADLAHICKQSGVDAHLDVSQVPLSAAAAQVVAQDTQALKTVLTGGDDYEILCTVAMENTGTFEAEMTRAGVPVRRIGRMLAPKAGAQGRVQLTHNGAAFSLDREVGFRHF
ncbi:thiamine-phosphate kinase [Polycladidibacter hongkongensis]|uniref:thiamine-phosphate kinase n=1 Tax=Polycladidibacter hongkongensis TaxID=1647556 RepID=UPI00082A2301|nr:thiamine-phosphate kinase [Pseudovibrio hongkongensis]